MRKQRRGFTATELTVCIALGTMFTTQILSAVQRAREAARNAQCKNNLRQFGIVFHTFAEQDAAGRFSTGVPSLKYDGCPSIYGWVADSVNSGSPSPNELRCPENEAVGATFLYDLLVEKDERNTGPDERRGDTYSSHVVKSSTPLSEQRATDIQRKFIKNGYNTNYTASWFFGRRGIDYKKNSEKLMEVESLDLTLGPLNLTHLDLADAPASNVPLLADGRPASGKRGTLPMDLGDLKKGAKLVEPMLAGPVFWDSGLHETLDVAGKNLLGKKRASTHYRFPKTVDEFALLHKGDAYPDGKIQFDSDARFNKMFGGDDGVLWMQDTRRWGMAKGAAPEKAGGRSGRNRPAPKPSKVGGHFNVLMANGAVKEFKDFDGDGYLNPGFPAESGKSEINGYKSSKVELPPFEIFSGVNLKSQPAKAFFE